MNELHDDRRGRFRIPLDADSARVEAATAVPLKGAYRTDNLLEDIKGDIGGFSQEGPYTAMYEVEREPATFDVQIGLNSVSVKDPFTNSVSGENDFSDRIRIKSSSEIKLKNIGKGLVSAVNSVGDCLGHFGVDPDITTITLTVEFYSNSDRSYEFGLKRYTDRGISESGYETECFGNRIRVKAVPFEEYKTGIEDLAKLTHEKIESK